MVTISDVLLLCSRFDRVVEPLTKGRKEGRTKYKIADEYDVQDLLLATLKPFLDDLVKEDPTRKVGPVAGRVDLWTPTLGLVIEVKALVKPRRRDEQVIMRECLPRPPIYATVPGINALAFFIYDPYTCVSDRDNFQRGLERQHHRHGSPGTFPVYVVGPGFERTFPSTLNTATKPRRKSISEGDALNILGRWFRERPAHETRNVVFFDEVDELLGLPEGTTKKYLVKAVEPDYVPVRVDETTATFKHVERERPLSRAGMFERGGF